MWLERLDLENFCQYRRKTFEFAGNLIAIIGPNGSGKSNLLKAIYSAATGDYRRNTGVKAKNVLFGHESEPSRIGLRYRHANSVYSVSRAVANAQTILNIDGMVIEGDTAVTARILRGLGLSDPRLLSEYVFVDQGKIYDFIDRTDSKRMEAFTRLFDLQKVAKLNELVRTRTRIAVDGSAVADLAAAKKELAARMGQLYWIRRTLRQFDDVKDFNPRDSPDNAIVDGYSRWTSVKTQLETENNILRKLNDDAEQTRTALAAAEEALNNAPPIQQSRDDYQVATKAIAEHTRYRDHLAAVATAEARRQELQAKYSELAVPAACDVNADPRAALIICRTEIGTITKRLDRFKAGDVDFCPTCGTCVAEMSLDTDEEHLESLKKREQMLVANLATWEAFVEADRAYKQHHAKLHEQLGEVNATLAELNAKPIEATAMAVDVAEQVVKSFSAMELQHRQLNDAVVSQRSRLTELESSIRVAAERIQKLADCPEISQEEVNEAARRLNASITRHTRRTYLDGVIYQLRERMQRCQESVQLLSQRVEQQRCTVAWSSRCSRLAEIFRDLPRLIAHDGLVNSSRLINPVLSAFQSEFWVEPSDDLDFVARFYDGKIQEAGRLSGGQKGVLGLAFHFAMNSSYARDVGLLCLDEPTVFLDKHHVSRMEPAFERLREMLGESGMQCIIVTHEERIAHLFDQVIELGGTQ